MPEINQFVQTGEQSALCVNTSDDSENPTYMEIDLVENVDMDMSHEAKEIKPRKTTRKGWAANLIGLNSFTGSFTLYIPSNDVVSTDPSVVAYNYIQRAATNRTPVELLFIDGGLPNSTTAVPAIRAVCGVSRSRSESGDDPVQETYNYEFVLNDLQDAPQEGTVTGGIFTPDSD